MKKTVIISNIYTLDETTRKCCVTFYELLMCGEDVTPNMILAKIAGKDIHYFDNKNIDELDDELKKYRLKQKQIMVPLAETINRNAKEGEVKKIHVKGHSYAYRYIGEDKDPLSFMRLSAVKKEVEDFRQFCYDSAGFFPLAWMEHFFKNTQELLDIKQTRNKGGAVMSVSIDRKLDNIEILPILYEKIRNKKVIAFDYCRHYESTPSHRIIHPHFLHEFNGRWHLFGYEKDGDMNPANVSIDRITNDGMITDVNDVEYVPAEIGFYNDYFKNMIGVTHGLPPTPADWHESKPHIVHIRAHDKYIYGLTKSKPIHDSQVPIGEYDEILDYGDFELNVELNNEFIGRVLQYGPGLEIISPPHYREEFIKRVKKMAQNYEIIEK